MSFQIGAHSSENIWKILLWLCVDDIQEGEDSYEEHLAQSEY